MTNRNRIACTLIGLSLLCLYPGLLKPILSIKVSATLPLLGTLTLHESKQSIVKTIQSLHQNNNTLVAALILLFSIVVPVVKAALLLLVLFAQKLAKSASLYHFVKSISSWSMADVFVVGVLLAFLSTKSNPNVQAQLHSGFYFFLAYCLISLVASQVMQLSHAEQKTADK